MQKIDDDVIKYGKHEWRKFKTNEKYGFIVENQVQKILKQPWSRYMDHPDDGYDMMIRGQTVDVKTTSDYKVRSRIGWTVRLKEHGLADWYLMCLVNIKTNEWECIGIIKKDKLVKNCKFYKKGSIIPLFHQRTDHDCYLVFMKDLTVNDAIRRINNCL